MAFNHSGCIREYTSRSSASALFVTESTSSSPPKRRTLVLLSAESVLHARAGPWDVDWFVELLTSSQGGELTLNGDERERRRISLMFGADVYENWLNSSVLPPYTKSAPFTTTVAWPHLGKHRKMLYISKNYRNIKTHLEVASYAETKNTLDRENKRKHSRLH